MSHELACMFDTTVFNRILDGVLAVGSLSGRVRAHTTHVQRDELGKTTDPVRRADLMRVFVDVVGGSVSTETFVIGTSRIGEARLGGGAVPTESAVWDVSRWDEAKWTADDSLYQPIKDELDRRNKSKANNVQDALIAETAIKLGHVLVTDDRDLSDVTRMHGGRTMTSPELLRHCAT